MADGPRPARRQELNFSWHAVAETLIKARGLHEGLWRVAINLGTPGGFNAQMPGGALVPSIWCPMMGLVLVEETEASPLTVDAAAVNPRPTPADDIPSSRSTH